MQKYDISVSVGGSYEFSVNANDEFEAIEKAQELAKEKLASDGLTDNDNLLFEGEVVEVNEIEGEEGEGEGEDIEEGEETTGEEAPAETPEKEGEDEEEIV